VGVIVRELTALEIEQFDFSGRIPNLNMPASRTENRASAKHPKRLYSVNPRSLAKLPRRKQRARIGAAQPV